MEFVAEQLDNRLLVAIVKVVLLVTGVWLYKEVTMGICKCEQMLRLSGKTVIITGGDSGIGLATAIQMAKRGAKVVLGCNLSGPALSSFQETLLDQLLPKDAARVRVCNVDLCSKTSIDNFVAVTKTWVGKIDVLINNAGILDEYGDFIR